MKIRRNVWIILQQEHKCAINKMGYMVFSPIVLRDIIPGCRIMVILPMIIMLRHYMQDAEKRFRIIICTSRR